ncbi:MAG: Holliday junction branch migration protein RuvA [Elusimicrobiota bacterium]
MRWPLRFVICKIIDGEYPMIACLRGKIANKQPKKIIIDVQGVGYEVFIPYSTYENLPGEDEEVKLEVLESTSLYGGGVTFYGFLTEREKEIFLLLKEVVPGTGAKKALEYLEKIIKSLPEFAEAVRKKDKNLLDKVFGFRAKTAEKLIASLQGKINLEQLETENGLQVLSRNNFEEALAGLVSLGYSQFEARAALKKLEKKEENSVEEIIRLALRCL